MHLTFCFLLPLLMTLFAATANALLRAWSGQLPLFLPVILPACALGVAAAWLAWRFREKRFAPGPRSRALLALIVAGVACGALGNLAREVHAWAQLGLSAVATYAQWRAFVLGRAWLFLAPAAIAIPVLWAGETRERGRLAIFCGGCCGLILGTLLLGRVPTQPLLAATIAGLMIGAPLWLLCACRRLLARILSGLLALLAGFVWFGNLTFIAEEPLGEVNPFAPIAARDCLYTGRGTEGVRLRDGRLLVKAGMDVAPRALAQLLPTLLKPAPNARIALRAQDLEAAPLLSTYETSKLAGLYDALWVELPPAYLASERDFFGSGALSAAQDHLKPDGLLIYALDAHALDARMLFERLALLQARFPHLQLWCTGPNHWQLVASRAPITLELDALSAIADRPEVARCLELFRLGAPITLLSSCLVDDAAKLQSALAEPIPAKLPRNEPAHARELLFNRDNVRELCRAFADHVDAQMPWFHVPEALAADLGPVLEVLRQGRIAALRGDYAKANEINGQDPFLQALADRELSTARAWETLAEHDKALAAYLSAFKLAKPHWSDLLIAAKIAQSSATPERARPFYALVEALYPEQPAYLSQYADYLIENKHYAEAEQILHRALAANADLPFLAQLPLRFSLARAVTLQSGRRTEGLTAAQVLVEALLARHAQDEPERCEDYAIAYGNLLIEAGFPREGVNLKRHVRAYHTLPPGFSPPTGSQN
ncbi:MAG: hypothetical protein ACI4YA_01670 [Candidatus Spyradenecus sp.]